MISSRGAGIRARSNCVRAPGISRLIEDGTHWGTSHRGRYGGSMPGGVGGGGVASAITSPTQEISGCGSSVGEAVVLYRGTSAFPVVIGAFHELGEGLELAETVEADAPAAVAGAAAEVRGANLDEHRRPA